MWYCCFTNLFSSWMRTGTGAVPEAEEAEEAEEGEEKHCSQWAERGIVCFPYQGASVIA